MVEPAKTPITELPNEQKIFVGGLAPSTTEQQLKEIFSQFGPVIATEIRTTIDQITQMKRSRGFGFVVFQDASYVDGAANAQHIHIDGKNVEIKRIDERSTQEGKSELETRKVFVGGLPEDVTSDSLKAYFQSALDPDVKEARVMTHVDGTSRCFGYVTLSSKEMVDKAVAMKDNHFINNKWIDVKASVLGGVNQGGKAGGKAGGFQKGGKGKGKGKGFQQKGGFNKGFQQQQQWGAPGGYGPMAGGFGAYGAAGQSAAMMGAYQQQAANPMMAQYAQQQAAMAGYGAAGGYGAQQQAAMGGYGAAAPGMGAYGQPGAAPGVDMSAYGQPGAAAAAPQPAYGAAYGQAYGQQQRAAPY